jgi:hypothetical protein
MCTPGVLLSACVFSISRLRSGAIVIGGTVTFSQAGSVEGGAPSVGTPINPNYPMNPMLPSEQQPQMQPR